ncbi:MAG: YceI family protein [Bacteroidales bacterium]
MFASDSDAGGDAGIITLNVEVEKSLVEWDGFKPGGAHHGYLKIKSGVVQIDAVTRQPVGGVFYFDMLSIEDQDQTGFLKDKLESHLKSSDFFDVEKYPEAKLDLIKVDHTSDSSGFYGVSAALVIKGIRSEITFKAKYVILPDGGGIQISTGTIILDRTKWGINYGSKNIFKKLEEHVIADNFDVKATVIAQ